MLAFYREVRAEGVDLASHGDMLLHQWGTYDWGRGKYFEFDITRQLMLSGDDEDIWQLHVTYFYTPSPALAAIGHDNRWCHSLDEVEAFRELILATDAYRAASTSTPVRVELCYECAG